MNRNILILCFSQALGMAGAPMIVLLGGIIGTELSANSSCATLPIAVMVIGAACFSIPAALLMQRIGRRFGFILGSMLALSSCLLGIYAIASGSFIFFCLAAMGIGGNMAFVQQYRFAAAESVDPSQVGRAISYVLVGGILAAFLGPELANNFKDWLAFGLYAGSFAALAFVYGLNIILLLFLRPPKLAAEAGPGEKRPLAEIVRQPLFTAAVMAGLVSYGVMTFIMTATPVSMHIIDQHSLAETTWVIQSHVMAMFIPSLFSGILIDRFGLLKIMLAGIFCMCICILFTLSGQLLLHYWTGLVLLGIGWNFLFVGGTTMLTRCYRPAERFKVQAINDFTIYGFQAVASLSAGAVIFLAGWQTINLAALPLLLFMFFVLLRIRPYLRQS